MKKLIVIISLLSTTVFAQENLKDIPKDFVEHSTMNGLIVGYALNCDFDKDNIKKIHDFYVSLLDTNPKLNKQQKQTLIDFYTNQVAFGKQKGPQNSQMSCNVFKSEFDLMIKAINEKNAIPKPVILIDKDSFEALQNKVEKKK